MRSKRKGTEAQKPATGLMSGKQLTVLKQGYGDGEPGGGGEGDKKVDEATREGACLPHTGEPPTEQGSPLSALGGVLSAVQARNY